MRAVQRMLKADFLFPLLAFGIPDVASDERPQSNQTNHRSFLEYHQ
jgi:hypothetical protein